jgi:transposase
MTRDCLANDIETLKDLVMAQFARAEGEFARAEAERARAEYLAQQLAYAKRALFGRSSEKLPAPPQGQTQFDFVDLPGEAKDAPAAETPASHTKSDAPTSPAEKKSSGGRRRIPQELPRQRIEHTLPESERACECCGKTKQPFSEELSEQLEIVPAKLLVIVSVQPTAVRRLFGLAG